VKEKYEQEMLVLFGVLREHGSEFGYRVAYESARFVYFYKLVGELSQSHQDWFAAAMDAVIVQKVLPKLHGSRSKLEGVLWALAWACGPPVGSPSELFEKCREAGKAQDEAEYGPDVVEKSLLDRGTSARFPMSFDKVVRMWRKLIRDQFVTFAEA